MSDTESTTVAVSKDTAKKLLKLRIDEDKKSIDELIRERFDFDDDSPDDFSATVEPVVAES